MRKTIPHFFIHPSCIDAAAGQARSDEPGLSHQIRNVLRLKTGDAVRLLDGLGHQWKAKLVTAGRTFIEFSIEPESLPQAGQTHTFRLLSCLPLIKAQRFEWALEKLCELGVSQILPFQSDRCMVKLKSTEDAARSKRWQAICKEASEQCERLFLPDLHQALSLTELLSQHAQTDSLKLLLSERSADKAPDMVSTLYNLSGPLRQSKSRLDVLVLSGPEGGFSDHELQTIAAHNFAPVSLGDLILRSETACITAAGLVSALNIYDY